MNSASDVSGDGRQLASFVVCGAIAALANVISRWMLSFAVNFEFAVALAYFIGLTTAFVLSRRFVFNSTNKWFREYVRFALVNVLSFMIVFGTTIFLDRIFFPYIGLIWHREDIAHVIGVASPILISFYAHKYYSFRI